MTRGGGGTVSVQGSGAYEPAYEHEVVYGEVPDVGEKMTLEGPMPCAHFLQELSFATDWDVLGTEAAGAVMLYFYINEKPPKEALEILKFHDVFYEYDKKTQYLYVMSKTEWLEREFGESNPLEFQVVHADVSYIESVLSSLMSGVGRMITDQRTSRIYLWDTPDNLEQMKKTVKDLDVPLEREEFTVEFAELGDIESVVSSMLSPNGSLLSDSRTGQIFVWDSPTLLEQMRLAVSRLDVPVESRTFEIEHVNAEDVTDLLEDMMSERGMIQVDPRYNALIVTDLPKRLEKIAKMVETLDRKLETRTWVIKYADMDFIADEIEVLIPDEMGEIVLNEDVHQLTVTGLPNRLDEIDKLITTWDIKRRQVLIEAFIVQVSDDVQRKFNINWSYYDSTGNAPIAIHSGEGYQDMAAPSGTGETMSVGQLPYQVPLYGALELSAAGEIVRPMLTNIAGNPVIDKLSGNNLAVTLTYLDQQNKATILSSPRVVVQDGEEALFESASRVPYISGSTFYNRFDAPGNSTNRIEFIDVGTILSVLPRITEEDNILLDISAEDSDVEKSVYPEPDRPVPQKAARRAETQLRVHTGDTVVLGGLRKQRADKGTSKMPVLGDIPLLGRLFRNPSRSSLANTLLIFITTTIVDEFTHPEVRSLTNAIETLAEANRHNNSSLWKRMEDRVPDRIKDNLPGIQKEIGVSIGQSGSMHSEGERVSLEELRDTFFKQKFPSRVRVVLRSHPRAPDSVITEVTEAAMEANLKLEFDDSVIPLVPVYHDEEEADGVAPPEAEAEAEP